MTSGHERLLQAATRLLSERPDHEPSTREVCDAAGVNAPTLYHHYGTKAGLMDAVVGDAFEAYLDRKRGVPRTGDLVADFAAGWDLHVSFGVDNPVLHRLMHEDREEPPALSPAALRAEQLLRDGLRRLDEAGLLRVDPEIGLAMTVASAIGCVRQLVRSGRPADSPVSHAMRDGLTAALFGAAPRPDDASRSARYLAGRLGGASGLFTPAEEALLRQWLHALAEHESPSHHGTRPADAEEAAHP